MVLLLLHLYLFFVCLLFENLVRPLPRPPGKLDPDAALAVPLNSLESLSRKKKLLNLVFGLCVVCEILTSHLDLGATSMGFLGDMALPGTG